MEVDASYFNTLHKISSFTRAFVGGRTKGRGGRGTVIETAALAQRMDHADSKFKDFKPKTTSLNLSNMHTCRTII